MKPLLLTSYRDCVESRTRRPTAERWVDERRLRQHRQAEDARIERAGIANGRHSMRSLRRVRVLPPQQRRRQRLWHERQRCRRLRQGRQLVRRLHQPAVRRGSVQLLGHELHLGPQLQQLLFQRSVLATCSDTCQVSIAELSSEPADLAVHWVCGKGSGAMMLA
jgi:hypothetical protein